jgi:hypothetical protein
MEATIVKSLAKIFAFFCLIHDLHSISGFLSRHMEKESDDMPDVLVA